MVPARCAHAHTGDFLVEVEPVIRHLSSGSSGFRLAIGSPISHKELSRVGDRILGDPPPTLEPFAWEQRGTKLESLENADQALREMIDGQISEIKRLSLESLIKEFAASCPDRPSMRQVMHLAALAWIADFNTLMDYEKTFERGYHLNFAPMITRGMIHRAVEIALERT